MVKTFNDDSRYVEWTRQVVGDARWELERWSHTGPDGVTRDFEAWLVVGSNDVPEGFVGPGEELFVRCDVAAVLMARAFPELRAVFGSYMHPEGTRGFWMPHAWCVDSEGRIVDPTGRQFDIEGGAVDSYREGEYSS